MKFIPERNSKDIKIVTIFQSIAWRSNGIHTCHIRDQQGAESRGGQKLSTAGRSSAGNNGQLSHEHGKQKGQVVTKKKKNGDKERAGDSATSHTKRSIQDGTTGELETSGKD